MAGTEEPRRITKIEPDPDYWQALGEFVEAFATIEAAMFNYLAHCADNMSVGVARAVFSGIHALDASAFVKRIWEVRPPPLEIQAELEDVFAQLTAINTIRNSVIHYASVVTDDKGRISSNIVKALTQARVTEHRVSAELLRHMAADLFKIGAHVVMLRLRPDWTFDQRAKEIPVLKNAWHYKRPQSPPKGQKTQGPKGNNTK